MLASSNVRKEDSDLTRREAVAKSQRCYSILLSIALSGLGWIFRPGKPQRGMKTRRDLELVPRQLSANGKQIASACELSFVSCFSFAFSA